MKRWLGSILLRWSDALNPWRRQQLDEICKNNLKLAARAKETTRPRTTGPLTTAPDWRPEDARAWTQFLGSPVGRTLMARGRAIQFHNATEACKDVFHTGHSAGAAKGFGECLDWLESLSRASARSTDESSPDTGQIDTPPQGEEALRELLSP